MGTPEKEAAVSQHRSAVVRLDPFRSSVHACKDHHGHNNVLQINEASTNSHSDMASVIRLMGEKMKLAV